MMLTDLPKTLRDFGLRVVEVDGWATRGHGELVDVESIICHHTAGPATGDHPSLDVVMHGRPDLAGPLANLLLSRDGTWYVVAAGLCWHAGATLQLWQSNSRSIGIEGEATGTSGWPAVQLISYERGCAALARRYGLASSRVLGHKEVCSPPGRKPDPNLDMNVFRAVVADWMRGTQVAGFDVNDAAIAANSHVVSTGKKDPDGNDKWAMSTLASETYSATHEILGELAELRDAVRAIPTTSAPVLLTAEQIKALAEEIEAAGALTAADVEAALRRVLHNA